MNPQISKSRTKRSKALSKSGARNRNGEKRVSPLGVLYALLLWIGVILLLYGGGEIRHSNLTLGQRIPATMVAGRP